MSFSFRDLAGFKALEENKENNCFKVPEGSIEFSIKINCKIELSAENKAEIRANAHASGNEATIIEHGVDFSKSLTKEQKNIILDVINNITKKDYSTTLNALTLSDHVNEYLEIKQNVLVQRGWSTDDEQLYDEIAQILSNINKVEKAKIRFKSDGNSLQSLSYTVEGTHAGYRGKLSFSFRASKKANGNIETFLIVTVLDRKKINV